MLFGSQREITFTAWSVQSTVVLCFLPAALFALSDGASTIKNGNAQYRLLQGIGASTLKHIHFSPKHFTTLSFVERTASRYFPYRFDFSTFATFYRLVHHNDQWNAWVVAE
uniref:Uncharacterized protein n=1 Tax=Candidatus Kentrum eta TaxID=2126337 RepID=A0A450VLT3_9GAMM|nr:MAG: hypothetical protein BECKH772A_GA0070896_105821 [Candidatus Kentron sp. H]VFK07956.1 MAG: hypothetical protein BECKH772B_GA0070898_108341 [Candidatus Kentron sp. H]VFK09084.1 MAG: hypothetical protein BECKH772C_GA0070978_105781 [Candidatus Kentron sp. H]